MAQNTPNSTSRSTAGAKTPPNNLNAAGAAEGTPNQSTPNFAEQRSYWKNQFEKEPYYESGQQFSDFESAYQVGVEGRGRYSEQRFEQAEPNLRSEWEEAKGSSKVGWEKAKHAVRAAWNRVEDAIPGDSNKNGH